MDIEKVIISLYQELFRQSTLNRNFVFIPTHNERVSIEKFSKWIEEKYFKSEIDTGFLIQYFEFQFSHYYGMTTRFGKNRVMLNWIVGKKAIERWEERDLSLKWTVKVKINSEFTLNLKNTFKEEVKKKNIDLKSSFIIEINKNEEHYKQRFYNTLKGFAYCQLFTTLYNPKSSLCDKCTNKKLCTDILKNELPEFYKLRVDE